MIVKERDGRKTLYIATCDICGTELKPEYDWHDAVEAKKQAGWRSRNTEDGWKDVCPDCQGHRR